MSSAAARAYAAQTYPSPQSAVTASSVNYSQYGGSQFSPSRPGMPISNSFGASSSRMNGASSSSNTRPGGGGSGLKPPGDKRVESRDVARVHWRALKRFLAAWLERGRFDSRLPITVNVRGRGEVDHAESPSSRASAREKLTRLTKLQFQELSTDVYDELMRRLAAERGEIEGDGTSPLWQGSGRLNKETDNLQFLSFQSGRTFTLNVIKLVRSWPHCRAIGSRTWPVMSFSS